MQVAQAVEGRSLWGQLGWGGRRGWLFPVAATHRVGCGGKGVTQGPVSDCHQVSLGEAVWQVDCFKMSVLIYPSHAVPCRSLGCVEACWGGGVAVVIFRESVRVGELGRVGEDLKSEFPFRVKTGERYVGHMEVVDPH